MVVLEMLAPNDPASKMLGIANDNRELAAIRLRSCISSMPIFFCGLASVPGLVFVVYAVKVLSNDLPILRFR